HSRSLRYFPTRRSSDLDVDRVSFVQEWEEWHRQKEAVLAGPHGFLAITSLRWLNEEPTRFEDAPGSWSSTADGVAVELAEGEEIDRKSTRLNSSHQISS